MENINSNSQSLTERIYSENQQITEIEKVARINGKGMFWQWVNTAKWFLGGSVIAWVLNLVMANLIGSDPNWFEQPLNLGIQQTLNNYILGNSYFGNILIILLAIPVFYWIRYYWNQISANFLQINLTEKLIIAGYGFWVGLEFLGFSIGLDNFYWLKRIDSLSWAVIGTTFHYLAFLILSSRWIKFFEVFNSLVRNKYNYTNKNKSLSSNLKLQNKFIWFGLAFIVYFLTPTVFPSLFEDSFQNNAIDRLWFFILTYTEISLLFCFFKLIDLFGPFNKRNFLTEKHYHIGILTVLAMLFGGVAYVALTQFNPIITAMIDYSMVYRSLVICSILTQLVAVFLIEAFLEYTKQSTLIPPEEPLDDFEEVQKILGKDSPFLLAVQNFRDQKILKYPHQNLQNRSQVYSIDAPWGTGKTTFLRLVESLICKPEGKKGWLHKPIEIFRDYLNLKNHQGPNDIIWIDFNPWNYLSSEKMVMDFFETLDSRIGKIYGKGLGKNLTKYVNLLTSVASPSFAGINGLGLTLNPIESTKALGTLKQNIQNKLSSIKEKIVIVIDDIDRLPPEMVLIVLRLVGITANFPNIFFVLAMDYDKVEKIVQRELGEEYQNYLQKIVNERVEVPKWGYEELEKLFEKYTHNAIEVFKNLEGLEGFEDWLEFEKKTSGVNGNETKYKIAFFEYYIKLSFTKAFQQKISDEIKRGNLKELNNGADEKMRYRYKGFNIDFRALNSEILLDLHNSFWILFENEQRSGSIYNHFINIMIHKDFRNSGPFKINKNTLAYSNQTPRDIKQLANNYIYGVAKVYDELKKECKGKPSSTDFQSKFRDSLNQKLPQIVQGTVDKQFQNF